MPLTKAEAAYYAALKDPGVNEDVLAERIGEVLDEIEVKAVAEALVPGPAVEVQA